MRPGSGFSRPIARRVGLLLLSVVLPQLALAEPDESPTDASEAPEEGEPEPRPRKRPRDPDEPRVLVLPSISFNRDDGLGLGAFLGARREVRGAPGLPTTTELLDEVRLPDTPALPEPPGPGPGGPEDPPAPPRPDLEADRGGRPGVPPTVGAAPGRPAAVVPGDRRPWIWDLSLIGMIYLKPMPVAWGFASGLSVFPAPTARTELRFTLSSHGWHQDWWFGLGNDTPRDASRAADEDEVKDAYHRFGLYQLRLDLRAQRRLTGALELFSGAVFTVNIVDVRPGTLLEEQIGVLAGADPAPTAGASFFTTIDVGLRVDTRDVRIDPTRGALVLGTVQGTFGATGVYSRLTLDLRGYIGPPGGEVVFAGEALGQVQLGAVPFYEYGVISGPEARPRTLSGVDGLRGLDRGRYRGPLGLLLHGELRIRPPGFPLLPVLDVRLEPSVFVDAIRVDRFEAMGEGPPLHPGFGGGVRIILNEQVVVRVDVGAAPERLIDEAGLDGTAWTVGAYGTIHQSF